MKKNEALEIRRQLFHLLFGLLLVFLLYTEFIDAFIVFMMLIAGVGVSVLSREINIPVVSWFLQRFERPEDIRKFPGKGAIFFLIGVLIVLVLPFGKNTALAAITILALGDSVSHIVGRFYGRTQHPLNKKLMLEGTLAGVMAGFLGAVLFVSIIEAFLASLFAMIAEAVEFRINEREADDNIIVPFVAALTIFLLKAAGI